MVKLSPIRYLVLKYWGFVRSGGLNLSFIMHPAQASEARLGGVHSIFGLPHDLHI